MIRLRQRFIPFSIRSAAVAGVIWGSFFTGNESSAQVVTAIGQNFTASTLNVDSSSVPPDSDGAPGPVHYVEFINGRFSVYDKASGTKVKTMTDVSFWTQAGISLPSNWDVTDPRVIYDPTVQRWFASEVDFDPSGFINTNRFLLAISASADPTGTWKAIAVPSDPGGNNFADYPTIGLDAEGVYLSADMFDANSNPTGSTLISFSKTNLLANPPSTNRMVSFGVMGYDQRGEVLQPAICLDGSDQGRILSTASIGLDLFGNFVTNTSLLTFRVQNPGGPQKATLTGSISMTVSPYTVPFNPRQPDNSENLDDGDARLSGCVYEVGGVLYAIHGTQVGDRAALRWYRIDAGTQTVLESGTISDPVLDLFYPSMSANAAGVVVIGYNGSSLSTFVSSFAVAGATVNGVTTFGEPMLLKTGAASYQNTDFSGISRWGDYSATTVDPVDSSRFWTIQEFPSTATRWSTQVTELRTGIPVLHSTVSGSNLMLSWFGTVLTLQTATDLGNPTWTAVTQNLSTNNGTVSAQLPMSALNGFFRLKVL